MNELASVGEHGVVWMAVGNSKERYKSCTFLSKIIQSNDAASNKLINDEALPRF
jgi:hypothetical protein